MTPLEQAELTLALSNQFPGGMQKHCPAYISYYDSRSNAPPQILITKCPCRYHAVLRSLIALSQDTPKDPKLFEKQFPGGVYKHCPVFIQYEKSRTNFPAGSLSGPPDTSVYLKTCNCAYHIALRNLLNENSVDLRYDPESSFKLLRECKNTVPDIISTSLELLEALLNERAYRSEYDQLSEPELFKAVQHTERIMTKWIKATNKFR